MRRGALCDMGSERGPQIILSINYWYLFTPAARRVNRGGRHEGHEQEHSNIQAGASHKGSSFTGLINCTGNCTADIFPACIGTCDVELQGRNMTRPGPVLSGCTGDCTPDVFPWCEGNCTATLDSSAAHDGHMGPEHDVHEGAEDVPGMDDIMEQYN